MSKRSTRSSEITIDLDELKNVDISSSIGLDDIMYLKHVEQRRLFIDCNITPESVFDTISNIIFFNKEDTGLKPEEREPIKLFLCSDGGDVDAGFELIDIIQNSETPVYTVNIGYQYSMAFLIGLAGHKRYATENAKFLMHDGANYVIDSSQKAQDRMDFVKRVEARTREYVLSRSSVTPEEYDKNTRIEWYMYAQEAKEKGFVDYIIGQDCTLGEVI